MSWVGNMLRLFVRQHSMGGVVTAAIILAVLGWCIALVVTITYPNWVSGTVLLVIPIVIGLFYARELRDKVANATKGARGIGLPPYSPMVAGAYALLPLVIAGLWGLKNPTAFAFLMLSTAFMGFSSPKVRRRRTSHESQVGLMTLVVWVVLFVVWVFNLAP